MILSEAANGKAKIEHKSDYRTQETHEALPVGLQRNVR